MISAENALQAAGLFDASVSDQTVPITVGIDPLLADFSPEIKYVFRTLLRLAGFPYRFSWANEASPVDIYYGYPRDDREIRMFIPANGRDFGSAHEMEPYGLLEVDGLACPVFDSGKSAHRPARAEMSIPADIIFASYWLLTGGRETSFPRSRMDDLDLEGSFPYSARLLDRPLVSIYSAVLRAYFQPRGRKPLDFPWSNTGKKAALVFTHDVDYPEIIRWIEVLRLLKQRGRSGLRSAAGVLKGCNHFWKFREWVAFETGLDARPTFFFMARRGSLIQYALGTPDAFYDIRRPKFRDLFRELNAEGCEIGLHASFNAYRDPDLIKIERIALEEAAAAPVLGNRHHYWHLDPDSPHDTLRFSEQAGLRYDSSLAFEYYPGFRRSVCHPFRPFHPKERRELDLVELPPTWMDNHFDGRLARNRIADPVSYASGLLNTVKDLNGVLILNYHVRGMNGDFYPRWGPWLENFLADHLDSTVTFATASEITSAYLKYELELEARSVDLI
jgi:hypothetical protein